MVENSRERRHPDAAVAALRHYEIGNGLARQKRFSEAAPEYERAIAHDPDYAEAHNNLGNIRKEQGRLDEAVACYRQAVALKPDLAMAHNNLGITLRQLGCPKDASACHRRAIAVDPRNAEAHYNLGNALLDRVDFSGAVNSYKCAIELKPDYADAYLNLGNVYNRIGEFDNAVGCYRRATLVRPRYAEAHHNLGCAFLEQHRYEEAIQALRHCITLKPDHTKAYYNLGNALLDQHEHKEAIACYHRVIALEPDLADAHLKLGICFLEQNEPPNALECYRRAIAVKPDWGLAYTYLGSALRCVGKVDEALEACRRAAMLEPDSAEAHLAEAMTLLLAGDFLTGWTKYEWRLRMPQLNFGKFNAPIWDGKNLEGQSILLHCEQGFGDSIQFIRYAPLVKEKGGRVLLSCPVPLARLFGTVAGIDQIYPDGMEISAYDCHASLMSLPRIFGTTVETIPSSVPYLSAPQDQADLWAARLEPFTGLKVGLVWAGNARTGMRSDEAIDRRRSLRLDQFAPLAGIPDIHFFSLQKGAQQVEVPPPNLTVTDYMDTVQDFADTAAFVANLDLVITVDTSVAHLAGALRKPVWILSRYDGCWRWLINREDSPWYPTLRLFRQPAMSHWLTVIEKVSDALRRLTAKEPRQPSH